MNTIVSPLWAHGLLLGLSWAGFACLALAMERHQRDVFGRLLRTAARRRLRFAGWCLLGAALWRAVAGMGWGFGLAAYSGHTSLAAGLVCLGLAAWNRRGGQRPEGGER